MPPRSSLSSFSIADANNEVVCPLRNQDGSSCRKRCIGEKRYRSMQEHIRRAHPEHYISKLPATEESFLLMINSPPSERPQTQNQGQNQSQSQHHHRNTNSPSQLSVAGSAKGYPHDRHSLFRDGSRHLNEPSGASQLPTASAAAALAQLGGKHKFDNDWDLEPGWHSDTEGRKIPRSTIELPPIHYGDPTSEPFPPMSSIPRRRELLPSILTNSPPGRSSTLPPLQRPLGPNRSRKLSITKRGHKKPKSRGSAADWLRRIQNEELLSPGGIDRKAHSVEPSVDYGKRWEDLIDAAASATEDIDDRTPEVAEPFPSVETGASGDGFHIPAVGLSDSSPNYSTQDVHIYCAACQRTSKLRESYACTECICGLCRDCVNILMEEQGAHRKCPRCSTIGGRYKPFQLDIR